MSISGREYFRLGAESYSSLGRVGKREENSVSTFGRFRLWTSLESSPVSVKFLVNQFYRKVILDIIAPIAENTDLNLQRFLKANVV